MKVYVAARLHERKRARNLMSTLVLAGHTITYDWTDVETDAGTPPERRPEVAKAEVEGVRSADLLVLLAHETGAGQYVEMGVALAGGIPIVVVNHECRNNIFFWHPVCVRVADEAEVLEAIRAMQMQAERDAALCRVCKEHHRATGWDTCLGCIPF